MSILTIIYLIGSLTFIIGLKMLSHPESARKGNLVAAFGMTIAIFGTIFYTEMKKVTNCTITFGFLLH
jgi:NAD(P) transhydrogenase subunit beta